MSIPDITTVSRLPRLGYIRLGEKITSAKGKEYPAKLDHFGFDEVQEVAELYGNDCKEIWPVVFPSDDEEIFFPTARMAYRKSGLFCRCADGVTATRVYVGTDEMGNELDPQGALALREAGGVVERGDMFDMPCPGTECDFFIRKMCKNIGRLMLVLPNVGRLGVYEIRTTSRNSMINILSYTRMVRGQIGKITGVPFALKLSPQQAQTADGAVTIYVLSLEFRGGLQKLLQQAGEPMLKMLAGVRIDAKDEDDIPADLIPNAGEQLERELSGQQALPQAPPAPPAEPPRSKPRRRKAAVAAGETRPSADAPAAPQESPKVPAPELTLTPPPRADIPVWRGKVKTVKDERRSLAGQPYTLYTIEGIDGQSFVCTRPGTAGIAAAAMQREESVEILFSDSSKVGKMVDEIRILTTP